MKRNRYATKGRCLVVALMKRAMTYGDMLDLGLSTSPWKRVQEALKGSPNLKLVKGSRRVNGEWLVTWRVVRA